MFSAMMDGIKEEAVGFLFNLEVEVEQHGDHSHMTITGLPQEGPEDEDDLEAEIEAELQAAAAAPQIRAKGLQRPMAPQQLSYSAPAEGGEAAVVTTGTPASDIYAGVGRNEPCPCGSGKKFKQCHGARQ